MVVSHSVTESHTAEMALLNADFTDRQLSMGFNFITILYYFILGTSPELIIFITFPKLAHSEERTLNCKVASSIYKGNNCPNFIRDHQFPSGYI